MLEVRAPRGQSVQRGVGDCWAAVEIQVLQLVAMHAQALCRPVGHLFAVLELQRFYVVAEL